MTKTDSKNKKVADAVTTDTVADPDPNPNSNSNPNLDKTNLGKVVNYSSDEPLRFLTNFSDIFIAIALGIFLFAFTTIIFDNFTTDEVNIKSFFIVASMVVVCFLIAEYVTKKRKLTLPSMVLVVFLSVLIISYSWHFISENKFHEDHILMAINLVFLPIIIFLGIFMWRYKLPFTIAPSMIFLFLYLLAMTMYLFGVSFEIENFNYFFKDVSFTFTIIAYIYALVAYCVAISLDLLDKQRIKHYSQMAFWAHLVSGPLVVQVIGLNYLSNQSYWYIYAIMLLLFVLSSLCMNRRAGIFASLIYLTVIVLKVIDKEFSQQVDFLTLMAVFSLIALIIGLFWDVSRKLLLKVLPGKKWKTYLPN